MPRPRPTRSQRLPLVPVELGAIVALLWIVPGCGDPPPADRGSAAKAALQAAPTSRTPERSDGLLLFADGWLKVGPVIGHEPQMELSGQCRSKTDAAKRKEQPPIPLCFDPEGRARSAIDTIRVDLHPEDTPQALRALAAKGEAVHFVVEKTGSIYQILDLAYAPRRAGSYQKGEIRIMSPMGDLHAPLVSELRRLFPDAKVEVLKGAPPSPRSVPPTGSPTDSNTSKGAPQ